MEAQGATVLIGLIIDVLNQLGLIPIIQAAFVLLTAGAIINYFLGRR